MRTPWIVMRSCNDAQIIRKTLEALCDQDTAYRLLNIDSGSTDGTVEIIAEYTDKLIQFPKESYVPGRVLNLGMEETDGEVVVFLNSDCTPQHTHWLRSLVEGMRGVDAAVYGRQVARSDAWPLFAQETERAFGDGSTGRVSNHFFSMANSAIRRSVWKRRPFHPKIQYSEDIEWTEWARRQGLGIRYIPDAVAMHSHNYTAWESYRRHFGEGDADARIFSNPRWQETWLRLCALPTLNAIRRDIAYCLGRGGCPSSILHSFVLRPAQRWGRYRGYWNGKRS